MNTAPDTELYERDFYEWIHHNVDLLRRGCVEQADLAHIAEEMEGLADWDRRAIKKRLRMLLVHLLKWKYQPEKRYTRTGKSFRLSKILGQRWRIEQILKQSPSLGRYAASALVKDYPHTAQRVSLETGVPLTQFPQECPFTLDQVLDDKFLPD